MSHVSIGFGGKNKRESCSLTAVALAAVTLFATGLVIFFSSPRQVYHATYHFTPGEVREPLNSDLYCEMREKGPESTAEFLALATSDSVTERIIGFRLLGELGDPEYPGVKKVVGRGLSDPDESVRMMAIDAVGMLGYQEYLPKVHQLLLSGHEEAERILDWVPYLPMLPYLEQQFASHELEFKKVVGIPGDLWLLRGIRSSIYNFLLDNIDNPEPRWAAYIIRAMGSTGDKCVFLPIVIGKLSSSKDGRIVTAAIVAIKQLADSPEEADILNKVDLHGWHRIRAEQVLRFLKWKSEREKAQKEKSQPGNQGR
jgi:hypothetical protein